MNEIISFFQNLISFDSQVLNAFLHNWHWLVYRFLLLSIGFFVGFINVIGGGGTAFVVPFLIFLGLDHNTANGTNRLGVFAQAFSAYKTSQKSLQKIDVVSEVDSYFLESKMSWKMALATVPGAIIGTLASTHLSSNTFELILGIIILLMMAGMVFKFNISDTIGEIKQVSLLLYIILFFIGVYGGFIQIGVSLILTFIINNYLKKNIIKTIFHKSFIVLIYTLPSLFIFFVNDFVDFQYGIILAIGTYLGGYISTKFSISKGNKVIKPVMLISMFLIALKLFNLF